MKKLFTAVLFFLGISLTFAQYTSTATFNAADDQVTPDSLRAYGNDQGVRTVWSGSDLDGDGKQEVFATDYSNGGRVHVFEKNGDALELVFSTPTFENSGNGSTPRWVRTGDLDGDGMGEFIFSVTINSADGELQVWEYTGTDNDYGTEPAIKFGAGDFALQGLGDFRTNRELASVYDFDGDGLDELVMANRDHNVYILGVVGQFPGFASWQIEGGDPAVVTQNRFSPGSWWFSFPADINGDGKKEIVNHYWNHLGFWSIEPNGTDTYIYPDTTGGITNHYVEYLADIGEDAVAYMGVNPADVDGDGKYELTGVTYVGGSSEYNYNAFVVSLPSSHDGVYGWVAGPDQFALLQDSLWHLSGHDGGSHWGTAAYDFNGNGRDEILLGGSADYNLTSIEYKGSGSILDPNSYDYNIVYPGDVNIFHNVDIKDSLGTIVDTVRYEGPFVSKMFAGTDLDGNGKKEVILAYQSVADSITYRILKWDTLTQDFIPDSTWKEFNPNAVNIRVLEYTGTTGFKEVDLKFVTPDDYVLEQNYPNPFNPSTTIRFSLPVDKKITLSVYDILGKEVKTLINGEEMGKGAYEVTWDGTNNFSQKVSSGTYIYTLKFGNFSKSMKMTLLK